MDGIPHESAGFLAAMASASKPNYLGNTVQVDGLLRKMATDVLNRIASLPDAEAAHLNEADCQRMTAIFLGRNPAYSPVPVWNAAGHIDRFVCQQLGWGGKTAEQTLNDLFAAFVLDWHHIADYLSCPGVCEDLWKSSAEAQLEFFRNLLLGIPNSDKKVSVR